MTNDKQSNNFFKNPIFVLAMVFVLSFGSFLIYESGYSLEVNFNGEIIGYVKANDEIEEALELIKEDIIAKHGEEAYFESEITTEKVRVSRKEVIKVDALSENIKETIEVYKPATVILVDNEEAVVVESEEVANEILTIIKKPYEISEDGEEFIDVHFAQDVKLVNKDVLVDDILYSDDILLPFRVNAARYLRSDFESDLEVKNLSTETKDEGKSNKTLLNLKVEGLELDVISILEEKVVEEIEFDTVEKEDSSLYKGESKVSQEGKNGEEEITFNTKFINGVEVESNEVSKEVIQEPVDKIVLKGTKERPVAVSRTVATSYNPTTSNSAVGVAMTQVHNRVPYVYGGASPSTGFDCSGLVYYSYAQTGVSIPRSSGGQATAGYAVARGDLQPGDIVIFKGATGNGVGHTGIYIGNGQMIHAPVPGMSVSISSISNSYFAPRYLGARRVV